MSRDAFVGVAVLAAILLSISFILISDPVGRSTSSENLYEKKGTLSLLEKKRSNDGGRASIFDSEFDIDYVMDKKKSSSPEGKPLAQKGSPETKVEQLLNEPILVKKQVGLDTEKKSALTEPPNLAIQTEKKQETNIKIESTAAKLVELPKKPENKPLNPLTVDDLNYKIKQGDTLSSIASEFYSDSAKYHLIVKANKGLNPSKLRVGDTIVLPSFNRLSLLAQPEPEPQKLEMKKVPLDEVKTIENTSYTVKSGDTGSGIAKKFYGSGSKWRLIQEANPKADLGKLKVGQVLVLPSLK